MSAKYALTLYIPYDGCMQFSLCIRITQQNFCLQTKRHKVVFHCSITSMLNPTKYGSMLLSNGLDLLLRCAHFYGILNK